MTKKHFNAIANAIANLELTVDGKKHVATRIASSLIGTNNKFDPYRFTETVEKYIKERDRHA